MKDFSIKIWSLTFLFALLAILLTNCGSKDEQPKKEAVDETAGLTAFELENGIGPIREKLQLGAIDNALAKKGEELFNTKCSSCHKLDERYT
ncbi:MAG: cytochrome c, partial [Ignavibacteria bacterium]|nr:cytochrome c [Ignavibacteria bacterium]